MLRHYAKLLHAVLTASLMLVAMAGVTVAGPLEDGRAAYTRGDYATALRLLRPLVDQDNADAQDALAVMYFVGQGVPQNRAEAVRLYRLAAEQGNAHAQDTLGFAYLDGVEVQQNYAEAVKWFSRAADQGSIDAQFNLGQMYELGTGVPQNYVVAYMWFSLVSAPGDRPYASESRNRVATHLTSEQINEAQKLTRDWKPKAER
jgi:uncharacterized protein